MNGSREIRHGIDLSFGPLGGFQGQAAQRLDQGVGQSRELKPQLIAFHPVGGEPVGEQAHLLLDTILHLAAGAVELLVQVLCGPRLSRQ